MREIKFSYIYQHDDTGRILNKIFDIHEIELELMGECFIERYTLIARRQYTGLKDKNGVEIYNKDIIKDGSRLWIVEISSLYGVVLRLLKDKKITRPYVKFEKHLIIDFEVIGNLYENPELLNDTK